MAGKKLFQRVGNTRIIPISIKLLLIFVCLLLLSNFATNFISSVFSQTEIINLNNTIMVSRLEDIYSAAGNQYQIAQFTNDMDASVASIKNLARRSFEFENSLALAFDIEGKILFSACANSSQPDLEQFPDSAVLDTMNSSLTNGVSDGSVHFNTPAGEYFGVYKFHPDWQCYFLRAELRADTNSATLSVFGVISIVIIVLIIFFLAAGLYMFRKILGNIRRITEDLYIMQSEQQLRQIDLSESPNDDITYLAASFNSLSATINTLLGIFQKFVSKDVVRKAYSEHEIRLEGRQRNLTMLFSDIKSFTYRTETLGNEIIDLLNVHYDRVIHAVHENTGVIGSIIGDAILAVYGTDSGQPRNKSLCALDAAWEITRVTAELREKIIVRRQEIEKKRPLTEAEERVYQAVLIDIGVGIDGGNVFYGNIGSDEHMTNTVIGDNVNSASRLEGLTRIYRLPVIVSDYIKSEVEGACSDYIFFEIDTVQVKGKTEGKKIYLPLQRETANPETLEKMETFEKALADYYSGDWKPAAKLFKQCGLPLTEVFLERISNKKVPADWSGIWAMTTK